MCGLLLLSLSKNQKGKKINLSRTLCLYRNPSCIFTLGRDWFIFDFRQKFLAIGRDCGNNSIL